MNLRKNYSTENFYKIVLKNPYFGIYNTSKNEYAININCEKFLSIFLDSSNDIAFFQKSENEKIIDLIFHYIATIDKFNSVTSIFFKKYKYYREIEKGIYGESIKEDFIKLDEKTKNIILYYINEYESNNNRINIYEKVLNEVFPEVQIYYDTFKCILYIAVKQKENEENRLKYRICQKLFKSLFIKDEILWEQRLITFKENDSITLDYDTYINDLNQSTVYENNNEDKRYNIVSKEEVSKTIIYRENEKTKIGNRMMKLI